MKRLLVIAVFLVMAVSPAMVAGDEPLSATEAPLGKDLANRKDPPRFSLEQCLETALANNHSRVVSKCEVEIAEAQLKQALSGWWPRMMLQSSFTHADQAPNFDFNLTLPIPGLDLNNIKLLDKDLILTSVNVTYPLYAGGIRSAFAEQARSGVEVARQESRRTDLKVIYDVKRMYYGALLARRLHEIGNEVLMRLEVFLEISESLYKEGTGKVKKTDYLNNKMIVEGVRSAIATLQDNEEMAKAALGNTMGLAWDTPISLLEGELPSTPRQVSLEEFVSDSYALNPDWAKLAAGLRALEAQVKEAKSGFFPRIALIGKMSHFENWYDHGLATDENKLSFTVGIGLELSLFEGFITLGKVREAQARLKKLEQQKVMLREGLALQVKHLFLQMTGAHKKQQAARQAWEASLESLDLNTRAYQEGMVEMQDVVQAQLLEAALQAYYQKAVYDHFEAGVHLDFIVGTEGKKLFWGEG